MTSPGEQRYGYQDTARADILRMVPSDGKVIGSIGCGWAATEAQLVRSGREVHGVDISEEAIAVARGRITSARVVDPGDLSPFAPESLDGLILADVLEHLPTAWHALQTFSRMVKPSGWIVISVPNMRHVDAMGQYVLRGDWPEDPLGIFDGTHIQFMTHKRLHRWCRAAGLTLEQRFDHYHFSFLRRNVHRAMDWISLRLARNLFAWQIQGRYRRNPVSR